MTEGTAENMMLSFRPRRSLSTIALRPPAAAPKVNTDCRGVRRYNGLKRSHPYRSLEIVPPGLTHKAGIHWSRAPCQSVQQPVDNGMGGCHSYCSALEVQGGGHLSTVAQLRSVHAGLKTSHLPPPPKS